MIKHQEFTFSVLSPEMICTCQQMGCHHNGDWAVKAINDQGSIMLQYDNICELHLLQAFLDAACGEF